MPYIVTHGYRPPGPGASLEPHSRTAVATLDEARGHAYVSIHAAYSAAYSLKPRGLGGEHSDAQRAHRWRIIEAEKLTDAGGTIGPLPDGTVIEVRPMSRDDVTETAGESRYIVGMTDDEMVAAFNA